MGMFTDLAISKRKGWEVFDKTVDLAMEVVELSKDINAETKRAIERIKREAYKEGIWHAVYNYVEKAWEDGYLNGLNGMDLINMRRDFIAKVEKDTEARLTQSKEGKINT